MFFLLASCLSLAFFGCGAGHRYKSQYSLSQYTGSVGGTDYSTGVPTETTTGVTATTAGTGTPTALPSASPLSFPIAGVGYTNVSQTVSVHTRTVLKIAFAPGVQNKSVAAQTGIPPFSPQYSMMAVYITVGTSSRPTALLSNGLMLAAEHGTPLDFSPQIPKTCKKTDAACLETVTITISKPQYDYWCLNYGMYCSYTRVYDGHPWNGTLLIQTDATGAIPSDQAGSTPGSTAPGSPLGL